jgi:hypothetical protein
MYNPEPTIDIAFPGVGGLSARFVFHLHFALSDAGSTNPVRCHGKWPTGTPPTSVSASTHVGAGVENGVCPGVETGVGPVRGASRRVPKN